MASRAFLALTIVLALGGCTVTPPAVAPTTSPSPPTASPTVAHKFVPVYQVGGALLSGTTSALIVVDGDRGYVALDTTITAVDTTSGQQVWQEASPGPLDQLIPVGDVLVLVPAGANTVNALDAATGRPLWTEHESAADAKELGFLRPADGITMVSAREASGPPPSSSSVSRMETWRLSGMVHW